MKVDDKERFTRMNALTAVIFLAFDPTVTFCKLRPDRATHTWDLPVGYKGMCVMLVVSEGQQRQKREVEVWCDVVRWEQLGM